MATLTKDEVLAQLVAALPARPGAAASTTLAERVEAGLASIRERWPGGPAVDAEFVAYLAARLAAQADDGALGRLRVDDLYLAWWAGRDPDRGGAALWAAHAGDLAALRRRFHRLDGDELEQLLRVKLFVGADGQPGRIADYAGFGHLQNWLRVLATRTFLDAARTLRRQRGEPTDDEELSALLPPVERLHEDPMRPQLHAAIKAAFAAAVAALEPRQRTFLRCVTVDGLTLEQIASTYQVGRATVARVLAAARAQLQQATRAGVMAALDLSPSSLAGAATLIDSQLDLSLRRVLREPGEAEEAGGDGGAGSP